MAARIPGSSDEAEYLAELRRRADEGDVVCRALLDAPRDPEPIPTDEAAALARAKAQRAAGGPFYTTEQVLAMIDAKRRAEEA